MPSERYPPTLFILGTNQDIGKTTSCLGIVSQLMSPAFGFKREEIGYIKPVGQQAVSVLTSEEGMIEIDRDALLISKLFGLAAEPYKALSPVLWTAGATAAFIGAAYKTGAIPEREQLRERVRASYQRVASGKKVVVCEGTGQSGVGSVAGLSNGDVIRLLQDMGAPVRTLLITRGGIGSAIDRLFPHLISLLHMGCQVDGIIINVVHDDKLGKVQDYLSKYYTVLFPEMYAHLMDGAQCPPILGIIPEVPELRLPTMRLLAEVFASKQIDRVGFLIPTQSPDYANLFVRGVKVRSLECGFEKFLDDGDVFIIGINANAAITALLREDERFKDLGRPGLSGLILSCSEVGGLSPSTLEAILAARVPTLFVAGDSAGVVRQISELSVKIQPYDQAKKAIIERTYSQHLDVASIHQKLFGQ